MTTGVLAHLRQPRRLLIIKPSAVGDVVQSLAVLARINKHWPDTEVSWLVVPGCADLLRGHPMVKQLILFDRRGLARWYRSPKGFGLLVSLVRRLRAESFDMVIDLQGLSRSSILGRLTGAAVRIGLRSAREGAGFLYTHCVDDVSAGERNAALRYIDVTDALGMGAAGAPAEFPLHVSEGDGAAVARLLMPLAGRPFVLLCPTTMWPSKQWPLAHVADLARRLMAEGVAVVVSAAPGEEAAVACIPCDLNLAGKTTLAQLVDLIRRARHVVAADSGPMHIAAAAGRPLTAIFGPTNPTRTGPFGSPLSVLRLPIACSPCFSRTCSHQTCLQNILPEQVYRHLTKQSGPQSASGCSK